MTLPGTESGDAAATPDSGSGNDGGEGRGAQSRISQLVKQREEWRSRAQESETKITSLQEKLQDLEAKVTGGRGSENFLKPASFADLDGSTLKEQYAQAVNNGDGGLAAELIFEINRRTTEQSGRATEERLRGEHTTAQYQQAIQSEISSRFADVLQDQDGATYKKADGIAGFFKQHFGQNFQQERPELILLSFALASLDEKEAAYSAEVERLSNEVAQLRESSELGDRLGEVTGMNDESKAALAKGDVKGAIRNLGIVKSFGGRG